MILSRSSSLKILLSSGSSNLKDEGEHGFLASWICKDNQRLPQANGNNIQDNKPLKYAVTFPQTILIPNWLNKGKNDPAKKNQGAVTCNSKGKAKGMNGNFQTDNICIQVFGITNQPIKGRIKLFAGKASLVREIRPQDNSKFVRKSASEQVLCLTVNLPTYATTKRGFLIVNATVGNQKLFAMKSVNVISLNRMVVIQTDKYYYTRNENVRFVVMILNPDFTSIPTDLRIDKISVLDPEGKISNIWNNVTFVKGYSQKSMVLEDNPINGKWKIVVEDYGGGKNTEVYPGKKEETDFIVNEQPKKTFSVSIQGNTYIARNGKNTRFKVCKFL